MSIHRYFKSKLNSPIPSQAQLSPNAAKEVNQAVTAALEREELGNQASKVKKRNYNMYMYLMPKDRTAPGRYGLLAWQFAIVRITIWLV